MKKNLNEILPIAFTKDELGTTPICMGFADRETGEKFLLEELTETEAAEKNFFDALMNPQTD